MLMRLIQLFAVVEMSSEVLAGEKDVPTDCVVVGPVVWVLMGKVENSVATVVDVGIVGVVSVPVVL